MKAISIKDLAEYAGVSTTTVSNVINGNGRFSMETRRKVETAIKDLGYRSNVLAKSLRTMKSYSIGVIVPDITNDFFSKIILGIENYCYPKGYSVYISNTSEDKQKALQCMADLEAKGVDGLIDLGGDTLTLRDNLQRHIPITYIDRKPEKSEDPFIESDNFNGGLIAGEELLDKGCKNIIVLRDYRELSTMTQRISGLKKAYEKYDAELDEENIYKISVSAVSAEECVDKIIESSTEFDGIFAMTDWLAIGALASLKKHQIKVPGEVKVIGYDNIEVTKYVDPKVTTVNQDKQLMGKKAATVLLDLINGKTTNDDKTVIPVKLIKRETT